jgi:hypothetical protein
MQRGRSANLLPYVTYLRVSCPSFIFSNFKFHNEIKLVLIVHNDHMVDLVMCSYVDLAIWLLWFTCSLDVNC